MTTKDQLIDFLISKEIPSNLDTKKESKIVSQIFKYCWDLTPESLYRYRPCTESAFNALENDKFTLVKPTLFNDPYDSLLYIDRQKIIDSIKLPENDDVDEIEKLKNNIRYRKSQIKLLGKEYVESFLQLKPFKNQKEREFYQNLSLGIYSNFIDRLIDESIKSLKQSAKVACLSETFESVLMWSHYAQNHQGFALNYDFKSRYSINTGIPGIKGTDFVDKKLFPIRYSNERFNATYYVEFHFIDNYFRQIGLKFTKPFFDKLFYYKILLFKSLDWEYEKEWRIIKQTNIDYTDGKPDVEFIYNIKPKEILLGSQINEKNKERLIEIAKSKNIEIYQMKLEIFSKEYKMIKQKISSNK